MGKRFSTGYKHIVIKPLTILILLGVFSFFLSQKGDTKSHSVSEGKASAEATHSSKAKFRILHIMSYHSPWEWADSQFNGFKSALKELDVEYRVFQMNTKRKSSQEWKEEIGKKARDLIESWKPDLVYTSDDNAQEYVAKHYINKDIPFVFSGVNANPEKYGFVGSKNITGVLEREHFVESVRLLKEIVPGIKRIAVITDNGPTYLGVVKRMKQKSGQISDIEFVSWDTIDTFQEFKKKIKDYQGKADAVAVLGVYVFKGKDGNNVPYTDVLKWVAENSSLPDFTFWEHRVTRGILCAVTQSGYEMGLAAGKIARGILADGRSPSCYQMKPTVKGMPVINLARAKRLRLKIKTRILLSSKIIGKFEWEK